MSATYHPWPLWRIRFAYLWRVAKRVFWLGDTTTIRVQLAIASIGFAAGLWLPLDTFSRRSFYAMACVMPAWAWGAVFFLHAVGVFWRLFDPERRGNWAFAVNALGFGVWAISTGLIWMSVGEYSPGLALEATMVVASLVAMIRTGFNEEVVTP